MANATGLSAIQSVTTMDDIDADTSPPITDGSDEYTGDDVITGTNQNDEIVAGAGNDFVDGQDGSDSICGESGDDTLSGGAGEDDLYGGAGSDFLDGGEVDNLPTGGDGDGTASSGPRNDLVTAGGGFHTTLITKAQFTGAYPDSLSTKNLSSQLVANVVKERVTAKAKANALADVEAA